VNSRFADLVGVLALRISLPQPLLADRVRNIEQMKLVGHAGLRNQRSHPVAIADGVGREIENDGKALPQDIDDMRRHRGAKPHGKTREVVDGLQLIIGEQVGHPVILADEQGPRARRETACKCRLPGGDRSAQKIQRRHASRFQGCEAVRARADARARTPAARYSRHAKSPFMPRGDSIVPRSDSIEKLVQLTGASI
jgi:hypothetical protein